LPEDASERAGGQIEPWVTGDGHDAGLHGMFQLSVASSLPSE